jgi:CheY-like chemotaxis protein
MKALLAENGQTALAALEWAASEGRPFSLVLTDAHMPGMDGFRFVETMKRHPEFAVSTVMMLTSGPQRGDVAHCKELGIAAYLPKPIRQSQLRTAIMQVLPAAPKVNETPAAVGISIAPEAGQRLRILLAEDNAVNQRLALRLLEKCGHHVAVTANGREALAALDNGQFDVVLMDIQMPEMDGFEATAAIRSRERFSSTHLPIIAMTAHAMSGDREKCLDAGMDGYIAKPIRPAELFQTVSRFGKSHPTAFQSQTVGNA